MEEGVGGGRGRGEGGGAVAYLTDQSTKVK